MPPFIGTRSVTATMVFRWDGAEYRQAPDRVFIGPVSPVEQGFVPTPADIWYQTDGAVEAPADTAPPATEPPVDDDGVLGLPVPSAPNAPAVVPRQNPRQ